MSRELTPLEALEKLRCKPQKNGVYTMCDIPPALEEVKSRDELLDIIETALKELAEIDDILKDYNFTREDIVGAVGLYRYYKDNAYDINKKLKALEIIKEIVNGNISEWGNVDFNINEYPLLKEVLR